MDPVLDSNDREQEAGEDYLAILIKQAGNEARTRKREALARHYEKIELEILEAKLRQQRAIIR